MTTSRLSAVCALALLSSYAAAQNSSSTITTNSSTTPSRTACNGCTVTASEHFLSYTGDISTVDHIVTATIVPYITVNDKGDNVTQMVTIAQNSANSTGLYTGLPTFAPVTWVHNNVTLTYPTTYVSFFGLAGGFITSAPSPSATGSSNVSCGEDSNPMHLPADSPPHMILPVNITNTNLPISAPPAFIAYLDSLPAIRSQFNSTGLSTCSWTKPLAPHSTATALITADGSSSATAEPVVKVSKASLTQVTADPIFGGSAGTANPSVGVMNVQPGQGMNQGGLGDVVAGILAQASAGPAPLGAIPGIPTQTGVPDRPVPSAGPGGSQSGSRPGGNGPSGAPTDGPGSRPTGQPGSGSGSGFGPAFALPNSASLFQGQTSVINGVTYAVPSGASAVVVASGGISATATGGVGGYIASGLGYTGPQATANAAMWRGVDELRVVGGVLAAGFIGVGLL